MLLTISMTATPHGPATDLGFLLGKHPQRLQEKSLAFGTATVFFPNATADLCTAALVVDVDALSLTRRGPGAAALQPYVNDRSYVSSSFTAVAIAQVFRSALQGTCKERPALAQTALPFVVEVSVVGARGDFVRSVFEPLGYAVVVDDVSGNAFVDDGALVTLRLTQTIRLSELLSHLYVLLPALDDDKHYFVGKDEVEKLLDHGKGWLEAHPHKELITRRYLKHLRFLADEALDRLDVDDEADADEKEQAVEAAVEAAGAGAEKKKSLNDLRLDRVAEVLRERGVTRVIDLGCGEGKLLKRLLKQPELTAIAGVDVSIRALQIAKERLKWEELKPLQKARLSLFQGSLTYRDARFSGFDAAVCVEVIEHLEPSRLRSFSRVVFGAGNRVVVVTTPNAEFNVRYEGLTGMRHSDHRFEWSRAEFADYCKRVADEYGYEFVVEGIGDVDPNEPNDAADVGASTQMAIFEQKAG